MALLPGRIAVYLPQMMAHFPTPAYLAIALFCALAIALAARRARALSPSGAVAATVVGTLLFGFGGWPGALALLLFFLSSTLLGRAALFIADGIATFEKGGERDAAQVLANGGVAAACALLLPFFPSLTIALTAAILGALAEANADTWATEIGIVSGHTSRLITTLRPAERGRSGAVSLPGTLAALVGAAVIAATTPLWRQGIAVAIAVIVGGFVGALIDSFLGATVQVQYHSSASGKLTERRFDTDGTPTVYARGLPCMGNDAVNALATAAGAGIVALLATLLR